MKNVPENELFSAYLDGEVTADEQADIEELIATDPQARQLLDELRALSATLQSLPTQKVGTDLSDAVLRAAERRMLAQSPRPLGKREGNSADGIPLSDLVRRILRPRVILWSAVAAAVVLMVVVATGDRDRDQIARRPDAIQEAPVRPENPAVAPTRRETDRPAGAGQAEKSDNVTEKSPEGAAPAVPPPDDAAGDMPSGTGASTMAPSPETSTKAAEEPRAVPAPPVTTPDPAQPSKPEPKIEKPAEREEPTAVPHVLVVRSEVPASLVRDGRLLSVLAEEKIIVQPPKDASGKVAAPGPQHKLILIQGYATPAHVEAAIARLKARPEMFSSVSLESLSGEAALAWTSPPGQGSGGAVSEADPSPSGPRRVRIGAVMSKNRPTVESQVHFDREPEKDNTPDRKKATPAERDAAEPKPQPQSQPAGELQSPPSPEHRRVIFAFQVVESDKAAPSAPAEK